MMDWLVFALLSPAFWGLNNVFNKFLITKKFQGYFSLVSYLHFIDLIFAGIIYFVTPISFQFPYVVFAMAISLLPLIAFWFYTKALMVEEVSRITPLFQFIPILVIVLSAIFLNEILSAQKYFGIALIVVTSLLISYRKSESGNSLSSAFKLMIPFSVVLSVYTILLKYLLSYLDYWSIFFWMIIGSFGGVLFLLTFSKSRKEFVETVPIIGRRTFIVAFVSESLYVLGTICALIAMSLGYASLVSALGGLQHFFVFVFMLLLSLFVPKILKEEISRNVVALKISAIALMFVGTWLITL
ncbi:EamA family transporter [Candidatus Bathyarchaeota archaeon]|nr:EamA family transporter [Candidatus Bathyarchaeota archaeon]